MLDETSQGTLVIEKKTNSLQAAKHFFSLVTEIH